MEIMSTETAADSCAAVNANETSLKSVIPAIKASDCTRLEIISHVLRMVRLPFVAKRATMQALPQQLQQQVYP